MDLKEKILSLEEEFFHFKRASEKKYLVLVSSFFLSVFLAAVLSERFWAGSPVNSLLRPVLLIILMAGLAAHYYFRNTYFKKNKKYLAFITRHLEKLQPFYQNEQEFGFALSNAIEEIIFKQDSGINAKNNAYFDSLKEYFEQINQEKNIK